jgi:hypothetical protein
MRHTAVERVLAAAMRTMRHRDDIATEQEVGSIVTVNEGRPDNVSPVIADITWRNGAERVIVEISVIVPEAATYLSRGDIYMTQGAASEYNEKRKRVKYRKVNRINGESATIPEDSVVPFIVESSGRLGPAAFSFVNRVFETQTYRRSLLISEIALVCARFNGKMLMASLDRYSSRLHNRG